MGAQAAPCLLIGSLPEPGDLARLVGILLARGVLPETHSSATGGIERRRQVPYQLQVLTGAPPQAKLQARTCLFAQQGCMTSQATGEVRCDSPVQAWVEPPRNVSLAPSFPPEIVKAHVLGTSPMTVSHSH